MTTTATVSQDQQPRAQEPSTASNGPGRWFGSAHNTALARAAEIEYENADRLTNHMADLSVSAAYLAWAQVYEARSESDSRAELVAGTPGLSLGMFAERLFLGGSFYSSDGEQRWGESAHTVALAIAEHIDLQEKDEGQDHLAELIISPMYLLAAQAYERDADLLLFAARLFLAGTVYTRPSTKR